MNKKARLWLLMAALGVVPAVALAAGPDASPDGAGDPGSAPPTAGDAVKRLYKQADFWIDHNRPDLAADALKRVLAVNPDDPQALYKLAKLNLGRDKQQAQQWIDRLKSVAPDSPQYQELQGDLRRQGMNGSVLEKARQLARSGDNAAAVQRYQSLFDGKPPPDDLAVEYYQTLAGVDGKWNQARQGLAALVRRHPDNRHMAVALAEVLTYRADTRVQGIEQLRRLDQQRASDRVTGAWRQALLWLSPQPDNVQYYDEFLADHPNDKTIIARREKAANNVQEQDRQHGYQALKSGHGDVARADFEKALKANPKDADALGGLGLVQLRDGDYDKAQATLRRAIRLDPKNASKWRDALDSAGFYGKLQKVKNLRKNGQLAPAFQAVLPLVKASGEKGLDAQLLQGEILLDQHRPAPAQTLFEQILKEHPERTEARVGLIRALIAQRKYDPAEAQYAKLSPADQKRFAYLHRQHSEALRQQARQLIDAGRVNAGEARLHEALAISPDDPWVRLDLARRLLARGDRQGADRLMAPLEAAGADNDQLSAAATFAGQEKDWNRVTALIQRIPPNQRSAAINDLRARAHAQARVGELRAVFNSGDHWRIESTLDHLYADPPKDPVTLGRVANLLVDHGEDRLALVLVRRDLAGGLGNSPADYVGYVSVLSRTGHQREANRLLHDLDSRADTLAQQRALDQARLSLSAARVNQLRQEGKLARAYDVAVTALDRAPRNHDLLMALGRLYQQGKLYKQAGQVFGWLLEQQSDDLDARRAAVSNALAQGDNKHAEALLRAAAPIHDPELLLLAARTAHAEGDNRDALALAHQAGNAQTEANPTGAPPALRYHANPFRDGGGPQSQSRWAAITGDGGGDAGGSGNSGSNGVWLPGQQTAGGSWQPHSESGYRYLVRPFEGGALVKAGTGNDDTQGGSRVAAADAPVYRGDNADANGAGTSGDTAAYASAGGGWSADTGGDVASAPPATTPTSEAIDREQRIDTFTDQLHDQLATRVDSGLTVRNRAGEAGLSELTEVSGTIAASTVPLQNGRIKASASPVFLNAGAMSADSAKRFGFNARSDAASQVAQDLSGVGTILNQIDATANAYDSAQQQLSSAQAALTTAQNDPNTTAAQLAQLQANVDSAQTSVDTAKTNFQSAASRNVLYESGINLAALSSSDRTFLNNYLTQKFGTSDFTLDDTSVAAYQASRARVATLVDAVRNEALAYTRGAAVANQNDAGLALDFAYDQNDFHADIGTTPLGFEYTNLVGGIRWSPSLGRRSTLQLTAERRAVTDSLLSYAGVRDPVTGDRWGGVTRSGASLGLTFDDGDLGLYGSAGLFGYEGHNVASNRATIVNLGGYLRPINEADRSLQAGVNVNYRSFAHNLSKFTYGHGGYFSPEDYISVAFPFTYSQTHDRLTWKLKVAPGFQSYSEQAAPYFPTNATGQRWLDILANAGAISTSYYAAESKSGFGLNLAAGLEYRLSRDLNLGTHLGYDTFGGYSETSALINLKYTMEQ